MSNYTKRFTINFTDKNGKEFENIEPDWMVSEDGKLQSLVIEDNVLVTLPRSCREQELWDKIAHLKYN